MVIGYDRIYIGIPHNRIREIRKTVGVGDGWSWVWVKMRSRCEPAQGVKLWFSEQIVTILAHPVQPGEYRLVVYALALDVEERPLAKRMFDAR